MEQKTIETSRGTLSYWLDGNRIRPRLLLLHGALMDHRMFFQQATFFRDNYLLIMPDLPMHGRSQPYEDFSFSNTVEDLCALLDQEKVRHAHVLGHSMGGFIAQEFYRFAPDVVNSLTCASSSPLGGIYYSKWDQWLFKLAPKLIKLYTMNKLIQDVVDRDTLTPSSAQYTSDTLQRHSKDEVIKIMEVIARDLRFDEETEINCPFLILVGESDTAGKVKEYSRKWALRTGADFRTVPLAAHMLNVDNPGSFNIILEKWLKTIH